MSAVRRTADRIRADKTALRGAAVFALLVFLVIFIYGGVLFSMTAPSGKTVRAVFRDTNELNGNRAEVRIDGIKIGKVRHIEVNKGGRSATVEMEIYKEGFPLYNDATAAISWRNLLGGTTVVELHRGTPSAGPLDPRIIPLSRTSDQVEFDPVISVFRGEAKSGLRTMLAETPRALRDPQPLARALRTLAAVSPSVHRGLGAVRGERDGDLRRLVRDASAAARALDVPDQVRNLIANGAVTLATTARREADVRATVVEAARVEPRVVQTLDRLDSTLSVADPVIDRLRSAVGPLAPTVAHLRPVLSRTDSLLRDAVPVLRDLRPSASSLAAASREGLPLLAQLEPVMTRLKDKILPDFAIRSPESKHRTYEMIGPLAAEFAGFASHFDSRGYYIRFPASGSERSPNSGVCSAFFTDPTAGGQLPKDAPLVKCKTMQEAFRELFTPPPPTRARGGSR